MVRIPKVKVQPAPPADERSRPWDTPPPRHPNVPGNQPSHDTNRRRLSRSSWLSIATMILIFALYGARAYQDLSSPSAWTFWKDQYSSPTLTSSVTQIESKGRSARALAIKGEIGAGAAKWFRDRVDDAKLVPGDIVLLSSPGGHLEQAGIMGELIRSRGLTTLVGTIDGEGRLRSSYCASACVIAYAGGKIREAYPGSALGVHQFTISSAKNVDSVDALVADTQKTTAAILDYMTRMGVSPSILQAMSATKDIRWLSETEAFDLKLSTDRYASS